LGFREADGGENDKFFGFDRKMNIPRHFMGKTFITVVVAVGLYGLAAAVFGWDSIRTQVSSFPVTSLAGMALLSLGNYFLRFWRWEIYLKQLGCSLPRRSSLGLYFTSYVMVITPGKIGEVFKAGIMQEKFDVPLAKGLPIVLAERIYDFLAVLFLAVAGLFFWPGSFAGLTVGLLAASIFPVLLILFRFEAVRSFMLAKLSKAPVLRDHAVALDEAMACLTDLLKPGMMTFSMILTVVAWLAECLGLWLACRGIGFPLPAIDATFVYAAGTLVGSLSFLPGGLGGTEATIILLLQSLAMDATSAATVALLVRLFTLWLAVVVGFGFFLVFRKELLGKPGDMEK
jgi:uncharacterized protein (TIRG00374 family)